MKLDFDINIVRKNKFELLDCQVDLILRSLELYTYIYKFIYPRQGKNQTKEENLRISLVTDTYEEIINQYGISKCANPVNLIEFKEEENFLKKIS